MRWRREAEATGAAALGSVDVYRESADLEGLGDEVGGGEGAARGEDPGRVGDGGDEVVTRELVAAVVDGGHVVCRCVCQSWFEKGAERCGAGAREKGGLGSSGAWSRPGARVDGCREAGGRRRGDRGERARRGDQC